jgi:transketolase
LSPPRLAYGQALAAIGARGDVVALDGEVGNSTHSEEFAKKYPERYFEMFIAEQQLVAAAIGLSVRGYVPFAATFHPDVRDLERKHPAVRFPCRRGDRR